MWNKKTTWEKVNLIISKVKHPDSTIKDVSVRVDIAHP
jgi:subtilisin-like proprotein convertase family protein